MSTSITKNMLGTLMILGLALTSISKAQTPVACSQVDDTFQIGQSCQTSKGFSFTLIERTAEGSHIYLDQTSGLIWGDRVISKKMPFNFKKAKSLCTSDEGLEARGNGSQNLDQVTFRLPTMDELTTAEEHGFRELHSQKPTDEDCLWSSDDYTKTRLGFLQFHYAWVLCQNPKHGAWATVMPTMDMLSVKCVGQSK
ncbi:MAG: hypothetical protein BroJett040_16850 [Oligoflexia bacterium]|nr:MAG: hypothetical protein BroJett040_16850 [Oligoflexia bacterium]